MRDDAAPNEEALQKLVQSSKTPLSPEAADALQTLLKRARLRRLYTYRPYPKQFEFHAMGLKYRTRAFFAGNQVGKTTAAAFETAFHVTGYYPWWWPGIRYARPILAWTGSESNESSREIIQSALFGAEIADMDHQDFGTGAILGESIIKTTTRVSGVKDVIDQAFIHHTSGGIARVSLKAYEQGWRKWQGKRVPFVWLDEEPAANDSDQNKVFDEAQTRTAAVKDGRLAITFTPLSGMTPIVSSFLEPRPGMEPRGVVTMTIYDTIGGVWPEGTPWAGQAWKGHHTAESVEATIAGWPKYQRKTRAYGVPMAGEGTVYPVDEDDLKVAPFELPKYFARITAVDFGIHEDHPFAFVGLAHDRDTDTIYVYKEYKRPDMTPAMCSPAIRALGEWIPVAWPHDGINREKKGGEELMRAYMEQGVAMLPFSARYDDEKGGPQASEPAVLELTERMHTGRFKVFSTCGEWFSEFRVFHRKDGLIVSARDDLMKATIYGTMMLRYAMTEPMPHFMHRRRAAPRMWQGAA